MSQSINIDFTGVSEGGGSKVLPAGEYICKVLSIVPTQSKAGKTYLKWTLLIGVGPHKNSKIFHNTSLSPKALWNLRNTILALGIDVPKSKFCLDISQYIGKILGVDLLETTYTSGGVEKPTNEIKETFQVMKSDNGWGRKTSTPSLDIPFDGGTVENTDEDEIEL